MKKTLNLTPQKLQYVMLLLCIVLLICTFLGFYYAQNILSTQMVKTDRAKIEAESIQDDISSLKSLHAYLEDPVNLAQVKKTAAIVGESNQYMYQNQVVEELTKYATKASINLGSFDFESGNTTKKSTSTGITAKKTIVNIRIEKGTSYSSFLKFVKSIEQNITKMQLSTLSLRPDNSNKDAIDETSLSIEVYLR